MYDIQMVTIDKMDVLMEDFSNIQGLIESYTKDREKLLASRNTWEVNFFGYDDDPREIPEIPEVVNWIRKSVDAGIPWFYFMRTEQPSYGLLSFMICCGADQDTNCHEQYFFDKDRTMMFILLRLLVTTLSTEAVQTKPVRWSIMQMTNMAAQTKNTDSTIKKLIIHGERISSECRVWEGETQAAL